MQARFAVLLCVGLFAGCYKDVVKHDNVQGHGYCQYRITLASPGSPMAPGQVMCIYCKNLQFGGGECASTEKFRTPDDGRQYDVVAAGDLQGCQLCPGEAMEAGRVFELK